MSETNTHMIPQGEAQQILATQVDSWMSGASNSELLLRLKEYLDSHPEAKTQVRSQPQGSSLLGFLEDFDGDFGWTGGAYASAVRGMGGSALAQQLISDDVSIEQLEQIHREVTNTTLPTNLTAQYITQEVQEVESEAPSVASVIEAQEPDFIDSIHASLGLDATPEPVTNYVERREEVQPEPAASTPTPSNFVETPIIEQPHQGQTLDERSAGEFIKAYLAEVHSNLGTNKHQVREFISELEAQGQLPEQVNSLDWRHNDEDLGRVISAAVPMMSAQAGDMLVGSTVEDAQTMLNGMSGLGVNLNASTVARIESGLLVDAHSISPSMQLSLGMIELPAFTRASDALRGDLFETQQRAVASGDWRNARISEQQADLLVRAWTERVATNPLYQQAVVAIAAEHLGVEPENVTQQQLQMGMPMIAREIEGRALGMISDQKSGLATVGDMDAALSRVGTALLAEHEKALGNVDMATLELESREFMSGLTLQQSDLQKAGVGVVENEAQMATLYELENRKQSAQSISGLLSQAGQTAFGLPAIITTLITQVLSNIPQFQGMLSQLGDRLMGVAGGEEVDHGHLFSSASRPSATRNDSQAPSQGQGRDA